MRQSQLFTKTRKEAPKDEVAKNAQLLIRGGYIHKELAGVYSYLPLGLRVLENIKSVIREEMNCIGGQELVLSALQDKTLWEKTDRWDDSKVDNWFKTQLKSGGETGLGITHEEPLTRIMSEHISSYRDLPRLVYQFQNKFRNELRAKSGIMRGKEFMMKDMYSFARTQEEHDELYARVRDAYKKICTRLGIGSITYITFATGGIFSEFSEEFQTVSDAGEDTIYVHEESGVAVNKEVYSDETLAKLGLTKDDFEERTSIETGNIFNLGTRFSEPLGLTFKDGEGAMHPVIMGSYGLGPTRLMGTLVEVLSDERGIIWPQSVSPFTFHLVDLSGGEAGVKAYAEALYGELLKRGVQTLYDDRDVRPGEKFADADLMGVPMRLVVSTRNLEAGKIEVYDREKNETQLMGQEEVFALGRELDTHATRT